MNEKPYSGAGLLPIHLQKMILINQPEGQYWLHMENGVLIQGGDLPMTEAAKAFFKELQAIADDRKQGIR